MNPFELLATFTELAVSYIGFASIVAAIQSLGNRRWEPLDKIQFRALIEISIAGVFLGVLPISLSSAGVPPETLWFVCSSFALIAGVSAALLRYRLNRRYLGHQPKVTFVALPLALVAGLLNVANIVIWRTAPAYLIGMLIWVSIASALFLTLVLRFFPLSPAKSSDRGSE